MICAACHDEVEGRDSCSACGETPLLDDRYALRDVVGSGGTGRTYRAERVADGAVVAIKALPIGQVDTVKAMELFEREASVLEQLDHPGIPVYHEDFSAGEGHGTAAYLVQEFVDGETLADLLDRERWTEEEVVGMMAELREIFEYLHDRDPPVVHRDVKPSNIMRRRETGELVLVDFGSVREAVDASGEGGSTVAGTFGYMAPEQFMGRASPATDIYGLAVTAVALLSRHDPSDLLDHTRTLQWKSAVDVAPALEEMLERMLESDPEARLADPVELRRWTDRIRRGESRPTTAEADGGEQVDLVETPRELPDTFMRRYCPEQYNGLTVGCGQFLFGGLGLLFVVGTAGPALGCFLGPIALLLFGLGVYLIGSQGSEYRHLRQVYRHGEVATGRVRNSYIDSNNLGGDAQRVAYEFEVGSDIYKGQVNTFEKVGRQFGTDFEAPVIYDPEDPEYNMMVL